jgi:hypothetical protein
MSYSGKIVLAVLTAFIAFMTCVAAAQDTSNFPYMNPRLSPKERATDLVHRMTLQEKASQLMNQARAIPRLESQIAVNRRVASSNLTRGAKLPPKSD